MCILYNVKFCKIFNQINEIKAKKIVPKFLYIYEGVTVVFVNKISNGSNQVFKGYRHERNNAGEQVMKFNHPATRNSECYVEFYNVSKDDSTQSGYTVTQNELLKSIKLGMNGTEVNLKDIKGLKLDEPFAYRIISNGHPINESGVQIGNDFVLVTPKTATPTVHGTGYFAMPDSIMPGVKYRPYNSDHTGDIYLDKNHQIDMENTVRTFSNQFGGNLAGMEVLIPTLKENGYKYFFTTPTAGADNVSAHHYWTVNNKQIPEALGNLENYTSFIRNMYKNGMVHVFDGTYTSEGLSGIHFQYALRWADKNPQTYYWFKMTGLKDAPLGLGTIPKDKNNLRHRVINAPYILDEEINKVVENPAYNPDAETLFQIYDASQVTESQLELDETIKTYKNIKNGNSLECNSHNDTLACYVFQVDPNEYKHQLEELREFNKNNEHPIKQNSPEGTTLVAQFSNFKIEKKTEGGFVAWDANTDMAKKNCGISGYDEKLDMAITDRAQRDYEKEMRKRGAIETRDLAIQDAVYWAQKYKDVQILYTAQTLHGANTTEKLQNLINEELLPKEAILSQEAIDIVKSGLYHYDQTTDKLDKDDTTVKALMKLPLDSLEVANDTQGVLSTSFFSNYATEEEQIGVSRFELMKQENPHLVKPYTHNYLKVNELFTNEIKNFSDEIIKKLNEISEEKLLDEDGNYTEYGENIINLFGQDIAKYAFLKAFCGEELRTKILPSGEITYDYDDIKEHTSLKTLNINETTPQAEASALEKLIEKGLRELSSTDIEYLTKSISQRIAGTSALDFAMARAMVEKAGLGISFRLDAAKDVIDMDAIRNGETDFDDAWDEVINFWKKWVEEIKRINPNAYIVAEITDVEALMRDTMGIGADVYNNHFPGKKYPNVPAAMLKFFVETGVTSEAAYSYFFTDMLKVFSPDFEAGYIGNANLNEKFNELRTKRSVDYVRNLYTFAGNHDKPRLLHGLSLDMGLFHGNGLNNEYDRNGKLLTSGTNHNRRFAITQTLYNTEDLSELPIEIALNIDNPEYYTNSEIPFSTKSVAMSYEIRKALSKNDTISKKDMALLNEASRDLANGNFLGNGSNLDLRRLQDPALSSIEGAVKKVLQLAKAQGLNISELEENEIVNRIYQNANNSAKIENYLVRGDFDWSGPNEEIGKTLVGRLEKIFTDNSGNLIEFDFMKYSPYVANLMALIGDAFEECGYGNNANLKEAFRNAQIEFVRTYHRKKINDLKSAATQTEDLKTAMQREAFGTRDIKTAIQMVIEQANYLAKQQGLPEIQNTDNILFQTYRSITEPAVQKACAYMAFLSAITGISTMYAGDELGMSGYDEKAKNVFLQNRNALPTSIKDKDSKTALDKYILDIESRMNEAMSTRNRAGIGAISDGSLYEARTSNGNIPAIMTQNADGDLAITVLNAEGIDKHNGTFSEQNQYIDFIEIIGAAALPIGYVLANSAKGDKAKYVVKEITKDGRTFKAIVNQNGGNIALNKVTAPNRVMVLGLDMTIDAARKQEAEAAKVAKKAQPIIKEVVENTKETVEEVKNETKEKAKKVEDVATEVSKKVKNGNKKAWVIAAGVIAATGIGYEIYKSRKNRKKELNIIG